MTLARRAMAVSGTAASAAPVADPASARVEGRRGVRITGYGAATVGVLVLALAFYMWTAASSVPFTFLSVDHDVYDQLTTAFLHGHAYLPISPPQGLIHLADPYDPVQNAPYQAAYHDLTLYHGRFYSPWGPTPVLTLFAPLRLITGLRMPMSFAAALYAFVGLLCSVLLLRALLRHLVPRCPAWVLPVSSMGLALTNAVPFLLRRPAQYELAIASGLAFEMAGLWLVVTAVLGPEFRRWRMIVGSLCLGLAMGGRPTLLFGGAVAAGAALWEYRRRHGSYRLRLDADTIKLATYAMGPFVLCGLLLALYNYVRFASFTDFGLEYELAGIDQTKMHFYRLAYLAPGLFTYLLLPARFALTFPHAFLQTAANDPFALPKGYLSARFAEPTGGVFTTMPITLLLLAIPVMWWRPRPGERRALVAATGLAILGLLTVTLMSWGQFATTQRYEVDFVSFLLVPAFLVWGMLLARARPKTAVRRIWAVAGVALALVGAAIGTAVSFTGYGNLLYVEHPNIFYKLEDAAAPFATIATMIGGSPQIARVNDGPLPVTPPSRNISFSQDHSSAWLGSVPLTVTILSPDARRTAIYASVWPVRGGPRLSSIAVKVSSQGPPAIVPLIGRRARLPVSLHWGLNRVTITVAGTATAAQEALVGNIDFSP